MARKRKANRPRGHKPQQRQTGEPDEVMELPFGYMARFGRFITTQHTLSPEEHDRAIGALLANEEKERREQEERREQLLNILSRVDPFDLLARASLTYLAFNPDTDKEWEHDRSPAHVEYLALQVLGTGSPRSTTTDPAESSRLTFEALDVVRSLFKSASFLTTLEGLKARRAGVDAARVDYSVRARLESLIVRGSAYAEHLVRILHGCLDPFDKDCRSLLGFTASEAVTLTYGIPELIADRIQPRWEQAVARHDEVIRDWKRARRSRETAGGRFPKWMLDLPFRKAKEQIGLLLSSWLFADARSIASFTSEDLGSHCSVDASACDAFLRAFTCPQGLFRVEHHAFPGGGHPLTTRPIIDTGGTYILAVPSSMLDAIRPRMEDLLQEDRDIWNRYIDHRGRWVEREATTLLTKVLPGSLSWQRIPWRSSRTNGEVDSLVAADDLTFRVQCKAGRLTAPARRGAPERMRRNVGELIEDAARQHLALDAALLTEDAKAIGFTDAQATALKARLQIEAIVCLDDVTVWATEAHELRRLGVLSPDRQVPWVIALSDLMVVTDLLEGSEFVHFLLRRQRLERDGRMTAHDELDWVGHYISEGLYFDSYFEGERPPHLFRLLSYTEPIDAWYFTREGIRSVAAPKPARQIPPHLARFLRRLEQERPRHWIFAAIALLEGNQKSRDTWDLAIRNAIDRVREQGWSNATQGFEGRLGVTLYVDLRTPWPAIRFRILDYCRAKARETDLPNWIGIGEGASGGLTVVLVERDPRFLLPEAFLEPPMSRVPGANTVPGSKPNPT